MMRIVDIVEGTSVDGPGLRTSIYFAGCRHECPGCHNPSTWDFNAGRDMSVDQVMAIIEEADFNVTFTGGDPLYQSAEILPLARAIKESGRTIWCYTGFQHEQIANDPLLEWIDVLVDGPFVESLRDTTLRFRGSSNQRIIDLHESLSKSVDWNRP